LRSFAEVPGALGHGRYVAFQVAGAAISQNLFACILRLIAAACG
jgi:hypothetical protein